MQKFLIVLFSLSILSGFAQSKAEKLFQTKKWSALVAMKAEAKKLSGKDIYRIGQGCMKEKQDTAAIRMFRMSIKKGYKTGDLYYNLGICYNQVELYPEAVYALNNALYLVPDRKIYLLEKGASFEDVKAAIKHASENELKGILGYTEEGVVSQDFVSETKTSTFDANASMGLNDNFVKLISWYDNEYGYSAKLVELAHYISVI